MILKCLSVRLVGLSNVAFSHQGQGVTYHVLSYCPSLRFCKLSKQTIFTNFHNFYRTTSGQISLNLENAFCKNRLSHLFHLTTRSFLSPSWVVRAAQGTDISKSFTSFMFLNRSLRYRDKNLNYPSHLAGNLMLSMPGSIIPCL